VLEKVFFSGYNAQTDPYSHKRIGKSLLLGSVQGSNIARLCSGIQFKILS